MKIPAFKIEGFHVSGGNSKVQFPIVNMGAAMDCPSRKWCSFDRDNIEGSQKKLCYAQKNERLYKTALESRRNNERILKSMDSFELQGLAMEIARTIKKKTVNKRKKLGTKGLQKQFVRINESSDLANWNIEFVEFLVKALKAHSIKTFLYSKAPLSLRSRAIGAGATVLHSERDFTAFGSIEELTQSKAFPCSGICGPCLACPTFKDGQKIGILEH